MFVRSPLLTVSALSLFWASAATAQTTTSSETDDFDNTDIIIVTGSPVQADTFTAPADVDVLAGDALRAQRSAGLGQTLDRLPGVAVVSTGEQVGNPVIRGLTGNRIRVLSNGIGLNYQQYGARHPANLDPFIADRIEIVRGPASLQYGSDALGGAVNVLTQRPPSTADGESYLEGEVTAGYQSVHQSTEGALTLAGALGRFGAVGTLIMRDGRGLETPDEPTAFESGNNRDPLVTGELPFTDFTQVNGDLALGVDGDGWDAQVRWETYASDQNYLIPDPGMPVTAGGLGQELRNDLYHAEATFHVGSLKIEPEIAYVHNHRRANRGGADPLPLPVPSGVANVDIERKSLTSRIVTSHDPIAGLSGQIGVEAVYEEQESIGVSRLTPGGIVQNTALFIFESYERGPWSAQFGLRHDWRLQKADPNRTANLMGFPTDPNVLKRDYTATTGGLGLSYQINDNIVLAGNMRSAFRAPDLFELYANGIHNGVAAVQLGNSELTEETAITTDLSLRFKYDRIEATLTGYKTDFSDYITLAGTGTTHPMNGLPIFRYIQEDAELSGGDLDITIRPTEGWSFGGTFEMVSGDLNESDRDLPLLPSDNTHIWARRDFGSLSIFDGVQGEMSVHHAASKKAKNSLEPFYTFDQPGSPFGTASTDAYTLLDISVSGEVGALSLRLEGNNIFDTAHRDFLDTYKSIALGPGRNISVSATYEF